MNVLYVAVAVVVLLAIAIIALAVQISKSKKLLKAKEADLHKYAAISDAELEAARIVAEASTKATEIVADGEREAKATVTVSQEIAEGLERTAKATLSEAHDKLAEAKQQAAASEKAAEAKATKIVDEASKQAKELVEDAKERLESTKQEEQSIQGEIRLLRESYAEKKSIYDKLLEKIKTYQDQADLADLGHYAPHFNFDTSEKYKDQIKKIRDKQKDMLRDKTAITCNKEWTVGNSRREGQKMVNRAMTLSMRAFNGECEAAIANCTFRNYPAMMERMNRAYHAINKANEVLEIELNPDYYNLKEKELKACFEYRLKKQDEKEEQRALREQIRDEERAQREIEKEIREAEEEERRAEKALLKARKEMEQKLAELRANDTEKNRAKAAQYQERIEELEGALSEAQSKGERALSMAQQTKRGHVYIISNIGSFGENVYKIGLTRRLDPQDRVDELGSASVPFLFDVHAMIKSDDAPALENALHQFFDGKRTNAVNRRKEFFNVSLDEIKEAVSKICEQDVDFIETAEAQHYYETLAMRREEAKANQAKPEVKVVEQEFAEAI